MYMSKTALVGFAVLAATTTANAGDRGAIGLPQYINATCECVTQASGFGGGDGTVNAPYWVCLPEHLDAIRNDVTAHYVQTADIDMAAWGNVTPVVGWAGDYNGQNFTVSNLTVAGTVQAGLFANVLGNGHVSYMHLRNVSVSGTDQVGALVGFCEGHITRCSSVGTVTGTERVGGLVGFHWPEIDGDPGSITECWTQGQVTGGTWVGGLVGYNSGPVWMAYSNAATHASVGHGAGLVGRGDGTLYHCYSSGLVTGGAPLGGLLGSEEDSAHPTTDNCYWDVETSGQSRSADDEQDFGYSYPRTTAEMYSQTGYGGFDFSGLYGVWTIDEGNDYARLINESFYTPKYCGCDGNGDVNSDGFIDSADYTIVRDCATHTGAPDCSGCTNTCDINTDGSVDYIDWGISICLGWPSPIDDCCNLPTGACDLMDPCVPCVMTSHEIACDNLAGPDAYQGDGTTCPPPPAPLCPADVDGDCQVGFGDMFAIATCAHTGDCSGCINDCDADGSGQVDFIDVAIANCQWMGNPPDSCCSPTTGACQLAACGQFSDLGCVITDAATCGGILLQGLYMGNGTTCGPPPPPTPCDTDVNCSGGPDIDDINTAMSCASAGDCAACTSPNHCDIDLNGEVDFVDVAAAYCTLFAPAPDCCAVPVGACETQSHGCIETTQAFCTGFFVTGGVYQGNGTACPNTEPIPTVSQWGLVAMTLLLMTAATLVMRGRGAVGSL